jgi:cell division septation protein DedD
MRNLLPGCALIALATALPALADVKDGVDAWKAGDFAKAVAEWRGPAAAGDPDAQYNLGQAYKLGRGVPADQAAATEWYRKAAASGHEEAQATLGLQLFQAGKRDEAMTWLKKAAERGEPRAQYVVGTAYFNGDSVPRDWPRAYALMTRAKAGGIGAATTSLAQMDQLIPEQQRQAGAALARDMERTAMLKANGDSGSATPLAMRGKATPPPAGQAKAPPPAPSAPAPTAAAPVAAAQASSQPSPARTATAPAPKPEPAAARAAAPPAKPASPVAASPGGRWKIQLGAYSTAAAAHSAWSKMSAKASVLRKFSPSYVAAGNVTRLQAGPVGSRAAANQACTTIQAAGVDCFPVAP